MSIMFFNSVYVTLHSVLPFKGTVTCTGHTCIQHYPVLNLTQTVNFAKLFQVPNMLQSRVYSTLYDTMKQDGNVKFCLNIL